MSNDGFDDENWSAPQRDDRGRFRKGSSGNPDGRPRKRPEPEWSMEESFARALAQEVTVAGLHGSKQKMPIRDLLITSAVRDAVNANGKDKIYIIERLAKLQVLRPPTPEEEEEIFTEEDRRILQMVTRELTGIDRPCGGSSDRPPRPPFTLK